MRVGEKREKREKQAVGGCQVGHHDMEEETNTIRCVCPRRKLWPKFAKKNGPVLAKNGRFLGMKW
jgi:hypothetical protein